MPIAASIEMLAPARQDRRRIKQSTLGKTLFRQELLSPRLKRPSEPAPDGNGEARLWPLDESLGHVTAQHLAEQPFALAAPHLKSRRQPPGKLDDAVIENGNAHLERH